MTRWDIESLFGYIRSYLNSYEGKDNIKSIYKSISETIESTDLKVKKDDPFVSIFIKLIREISNFGNIEPVLIALKNNQDLFDLYIFREAISVNFDEITSSEQFFAKVRKEKISKGNVISDIPYESLFNFLKAYYIYRGKLEISETSNNPAYNYSNQCLEMKSVTDLFTNIDPKSPLRVCNILIYSDEALPYSLDYLDDYIDTLSTKAYYKQSFEQIIDDVIKDKYLGSTLKKYFGSLL